MRFSAVVVLLILFSLSSAVGAVAFAAPSTQGFVQYNVSLKTAGRQVSSFVLNESSQRTGQAGFIRLTVALASASRNFTYSSVVNSSSLPEVFPYFVGLSNQSLSYQAAGFTFSVHILNAGKTAVTFNGNTYQATNYQVSVSSANSTGLTPVSAQGHILTMPSGLIYSADLEIGQSSLSIQLRATNLALSEAASGSLPLGVTILSLGIIAAVAFAAPAVFLRLKRRRKAEPQAQPANEKESPRENKPSYWVD